MNLNIMTKANVIKILDLMSFIGLLILLSSGILMRYILPPRSRSATVWGLTRHEWGDIHYYISVAFLVLMALHLFVHLKYIKHAVMGKASGEQNYRLIAGIFGLLALLFLVFSPVIFPVG